MKQDIFTNFNNIKLNILKICKEINRNPQEINIVAVSKEQKIEKIKKLLELEHKCFGENRLDETIRKWNDVDKKNLKLHYIGALQSKKVKDILENFNVIETLDTESSAKKIASYILNYKKKPPKIFLQINIGEEAQKRGIFVSEVSCFLRMCKEKYKLIIGGAMCLPPKSCNPEKYFKALRELCIKYDLKEISMGMSNDYEKAIEIGATNIRIGTTIFGSR